MKVLITGGFGMVGRCIKDFQSKAHQFFKGETLDFYYLSSRECDLRDRDAVLKFFALHNFEGLIHLAANVGGLYKNMNQGIEMFSDNVKINENVLEGAHLSGIQRAVFVLSSCIYPAQPSRFPMDETMIHESAPHPSNEGYAYAKRMLELQCRQYSKKHGREYICAIPVNLYGPYDNFKVGDSHMIPGLMERFHRGKKLNQREKYMAYGTGKPLRQFLYARDFAEILCRLLLTEECKAGMKSGNIICCNDEYTVQEVVEKLGEAMGIPREDILFDASRSDGCMKKTVSNDKFRALFPDFEFTDFSTGLKETYEWFQKAEAEGTARI